MESDENPESCDSTTNIQLKSETRDEINNYDVSGLKRDVVTDKLDEELTIYSQKLNSDDYNPNKHEIRYRLLPRLMYIMKRQSHLNLQIKAIYLIINFTKRNQIFRRYAIKFDTFSEVILLLKTNNHELQNSICKYLMDILSADIKGENLIKKNKTNKYSILKFTNLIKKNKTIKYSILKCTNLIPIILRNLNRSKQIESIKSGLKLLAVIFTKVSKYEEISICLPAIVRYLFHSDKSVATIACETIHTFSLIEGGAREAIIQSSIIGHLIRKLVSTDPKIWITNAAENNILSSIIAIIASFMSYSNAYKQFLIDCQILEVIKKFLVTNYWSVYSIGCYLLRFVCQGTKQQIQEVIDSGIFSSLFIIVKNGDLHLSLKAIYVLNSASYHGTIDELKQIVKQGCLETLCSALDLVDNTFTDFALMTINNFLITERNNLKTIYNPKEKLTEFAIIVKECGGLDKIKKLVSNENVEIRSRAATILKYTYHIYSPIDRPIPIATSAECSDSEECKACFDRISDTVLFPCGHRCVCHKCANQTLDSVGDKLLECCPLCRIRVNNAKRI